jgi:uncharacterized low-complexity protein
MNSKTLVALVGTLAFGTVSIAQAAEEKAPPAPKEKKGDTTKPKDDKKGGEHSCGGAKDPKGGEHSCGGKKG